MSDIKLWYSHELAKLQKEAGIHPKVGVVINNGQKKEVIFNMISAKDSNGLPFGAAQFGGQPEFLGVGTPLLIQKNPDELLKIKQKALADLPENLRNPQITPELNQAKLEERRKIQTQMQQAFKDRGIPLPNILK